jgi:hypothetical protein
MIDRRRFFTAIMGVLIVSVVACSDMVSMVGLYAQQQVLSPVRGQTQVRRVCLSGPFDTLSFSDLDIGFVRIPIEPGVDICQTPELPHTIDLTIRPSSCRLCLYALMSLGLFSTPHWIRRLPFSLIPEWYHNGGPFQIGQSFAVPADSLCPVPAYCFIQPVSAAERLIPQYRLRTIVSLWRQSQFTPETIASRGPPLS